MIPRVLNKHTQVALLPRPGARGLRQCDPRAAVLDIPRATGLDGEGAPVQSGLVGGRKGGIQHDCICTCCNPCTHPSPYSRQRIIGPVFQPHLRFNGAELAKGLSFMPGLSHLALGGTSMDDDSLALISGSFSCLGRLAHLDLSSNKLHLDHDETNLPLSFSALTALEVNRLCNWYSGKSCWKP